MKFIVDWIESILGLFSVSETGTIIHDERPEEVKPEPKKKEEPQGTAASPKLTKASLAKLTKARIAEEGEKLGITVSTKLKKDEMIKQVLKQK